MFNYSVVRDSQTVEWVDLDGLNVELVLTQHKEQRGYERKILDKEIIDTVKAMEDVVLDMRDGEERKIMCNATGVTIVVGTHSVSEGNDFWLRVFVITTYRNSTYKRVGFFRKEN